MPDVASVARGVYKPRCPQASPLFRLVSDHLQRLQTVATSASRASTARGAKTCSQLAHPHRRAPVHTTMLPQPLKMSWNSAGAKPG
jgi:hypothetical protein